MVESVIINFKITRLDFTAESKLLITGVQNSENPPTLGLTCQHKAYFAFADSFYHYSDDLLFKFMNSKQYYKKPL